MLCIILSYFKYIVLGFSVYFKDIQIQAIFLQTFTVRPDNKLVQNMSLLRHSRFVRRRVRKAHTRTNGRVVCSAPCIRQFLLAIGDNRRQKYLKLFGRRSSTTFSSTASCHRRFPFLDNLPNTHRYLFHNIICFLNSILRRDPTEGRLNNVSAKCTVLVNIL